MDQILSNLFYYSICNGGVTLIVNSFTYLFFTGGAGIVTAYSDSTTTLINSTVTGNVTNNYGGGILAAYGGRVNLIHSTVTSNTANANYDSESWGRRNRHKR